MSRFNPIKKSTTSKPYPNEAQINDFATSLGITLPQASSTVPPPVNRSASLVPKKQVTTELLQGAPTVSSLVNPQQDEGMGMFGMKIPGVPSAPSIPSLGALGDISLPSGKGFLDAITPSREMGIAIAGGLSDFGASLQGRQGTGAQQIQANLGRLKQNELDAEMDDPNSEKSKTFRGFLKNYYKDIGKDLPINDNLSYRQLSEMTPFLDKKFNMYQAEKAARLKGSGQPKDKKRGIEEVKLINNAGQALASLDEMEKALAAGTNTFSVYGDNDFTMNKRLFAEALGRMQSGGAIGKEEEERFINMAPTATDTKAMQKKKLMQMKLEMRTRLRDLDVDPNESLNNRRLPPEMRAGTTKDIVDGREVYLDPYGNEIGEVKQKASNQPNVPANSVGTMKGKDGKMYYVDANKNPISEVK
jgi:hypothetical protein